MKKLIILAALAVPFVARADSPQENQRERYADRIEKALERDAVLARFDLDADAKGGVTGTIEIEGQVLNASQRARAMRIARREAPGYTFANRIEISANAKADSPQKTKRKLHAGRIEAAFKNDAELGRFDLDADSEGDATGTIELEGEVRTSAQRARAVAMARRMAPGYTLKNKIELRADAGRDD